MTKFESNPLHNHNEDISFVIYLSLPEKLKKENEDTISNSSKPGEICFVDKLEKNNLSINRIKFFPEVGEFFIFPATLNHYVNSFQCEGERVSVSGNIQVI